METLTLKEYIADQLEILADITEDVVGFGADIKIVVAYDWVLVDGVKEALIDNYVLDEQPIYDVNLTTKEEYEEDLMIWNDIHSKLHERMTMLDLLNRMNKRLQKYI